MFHFDDFNINFGTTGTTTTTTTTTSTSTSSSTTTSSNNNNRGRTKKNASSRLPSSKSERIHPRRRTHAVSVKNLKNHRIEIEDKLEEFLPSSMYILMFSSIIPLTYHRPNQNHQE
jgi:hypothetical protein